MAENDFQYGGWNSYNLQCDTWLWNDMPLISPNDIPYKSSATAEDGRPYESS